MVPTVEGESAVSTQERPRKVETEQRKRIEVKYKVVQIDLVNQLDAENTIRESTTANPTYHYSSGSAGVALLNVGLEPQ